MHAVRRAVVIAPLLALLAATTFAQQIAPRAAESIDVSIVNLDVFVTDRHGNRVHGLTADDFQIYENGRLQPVTNFTEYSRRENAPSSSRDAAVAAPQRRVIVLFIESTTLAPHRAKPFFDSLRRFVRESIRPGDSIAVVTWLRASLVRLEPTDDINAVVTTLDELEEEMSGVESNFAEELRRRETFFVELQQELIAEGVPFDDAGITAFHGTPEILWELNYIRRKSLALRSYMEDIAGFDGKKVLIMATHRFGRYAGAEFFQGEVPASKQGTADTRPEREAVMNTANAHNITLYPIYPRGIANTPRVSAEESRANIYKIDPQADLKRFAADDLTHLNETAALYEIAQATGGLTASGPANIAELLPRVTEDLDNYYSLGYRVAQTGKDVERSIRVVAKNSDYVVRSRRQYVEVSDERRVRDLVTANVIEETPGGALPIELVPRRMRRDGNRRFVDVTIRIPVDALSTRADGGEFSVYIATGGGFGSLSEVQKRGQKFTLAAKNARDKHAGYFTYDVTVQMDSQSYRIAAGVFDEVSKEFGVARITVPLEAK